MIARSLIKSGAISDVNQAEKDAKKKEKLHNAPVIVDAEKDIEAAGHIVEDESETKDSSKGKPAWKRYYHLVVIAKNRKGLTNLFTLVKKSYKYGFYRFPRIDFEMLKEHGDGLVVSTACVGGLASGIIYNEFQDYTFDQFHPDLLNNTEKYNTVMNRLTNMTDYFVDCVGQENFFLELQFNKLTAHHPARGPRARRRSPRWARCPAATARASSSRRGARRARRP